MNVSVMAMCNHFKDDLDHSKLVPALEDLPVLMNGKPITTVQNIINKIL